MEKEKKQMQIFQVWWVICNTLLSNIPHNLDLGLLFPEQFISQPPSNQLPCMLLHLGHYVLFPWLLHMHRSPSHAIVLSLSFQLP